MKSLLLLLASCAAVFAADFPMGTQVTKGNVSVLAMPCCGVVNPTTGETKPDMAGYQVAIQTTNSATAAFRITVLYRIADGTTLAKRVVVARWWLSDLPWTVEMVATPNATALVSVAVEELIPQPTIEF